MNALPEQKNTFYYPVILTVSATYLKMLGLIWRDSFTITVIQYTTSYFHPWDKYLLDFIVGFISNSF